MNIMKNIITLISMLIAALVYYLAGSVAGMIMFFLAGIFYYYDAFEILKKK
jgi:hypothetical protein